MALPLEPIRKSRACHLLLFLLVLLLLLLLLLLWSQGLVDAWHAAAHSAASLGCFTRLLLPWLLPPRAFSCSNKKSESDADLGVGVSGCLDVFLCQRAVSRLLGAALRGPVLTRGLFASELLPEPLPVFSLLAMRQARYSQVKTATLLFSKPQLGINVVRERPRPCLPCLS